MLNETVMPEPNGAARFSGAGKKGCEEGQTAALREALAVAQARNAELELALAARDEVRQQLEAQLVDASLLHEVSAMLVDEDGIGELYQRLVGVATVIMRSDFGTIQRYDDVRGELEMIAHQGLDEEAFAFWEWVHAGQATTCGKALQTGIRTIVPDFERCDAMADSADLVAFRKADVKSAQSTPLLKRNGRLVGMITTHWKQVHQPQERELRLLDVVARQAADLIERHRAAEALRCQAVRLQAADRYKDEFLATLAHELRNPLAPIRSGLSVLQMGKPEQRERVLAMMDRQVGHMVRLIDDLLDIARISRGAMTLRTARIALRSVIDSAVETSRPLIVAAGHHFAVNVAEGDPWLDADATRLAQVVGNLLNNAAKYTPSAGNITLTAWSDDLEVCVRVADSGIGISEAMLPRIFDMFTQVDGAAERSQGGLGVGLALAKHLAELHGGQIDVESPGELGGSTFTLRLPRAVDGETGHV